MTTSFEHSTICTHPDHSDFESCRDRAVGCNINCTCCMDFSEYDTIEDGDAY